MRNKMIDLMKGIGIFVVVLAHSEPPHVEYFKLFHMAVFFIWSGYCYNDHYSENLQSIGRYIIKKLKTLYIPYVFSNLILLGFHNVFYRWNIYTDNPRFLQSDIIYSGYGLIGPYSIQDFLNHIILTFGFVDGEQLSGVLWFLRALFEIVIVYAVIDRVSRLSGKFRMWCNGISAFAVTILGYYMYKNNIHIVTGIEVSCHYFIFYVIGVVVKKIDLKWKTPRLLTLVFSAFVLFINYCLLKHSMITDTYNPFFYIINGIAGGILVKNLAEIFSHTPISGLIEYAGRNSLHIMLWHFLSFKLVSYCYIKICNLPEYFLASFPVLNVKYLWIFYTLAGMTLPLLLSLIPDTRIVSLKSVSGKHTKK